MSTSTREVLEACLPGHSGALGMRTAANALLLPFPVSVRDMVETLNPIQLAFELNAGTCSGSCSVTLRSDGQVHYRGRVHDSGALAAFYTTIISFPTITDHTSFPPAVAALGAVGPVVIAHEGHVGGTFSLDKRDSSWDLTTIDSRIRDNWAWVKATAQTATSKFGIGTGALELADGILNAATGLFIFSL